VHRKELLSKAHLRRRTTSHEDRSFSPIQAFGESLRTFGQKVPAVNWAEPQPDMDFDGDDWTFFLLFGEDWLF